MALLQNCLSALLCSICGACMILSGKRGCDPATLARSSPCGLVSSSPLSLDPPSLLLQFFRSFCVHPRIRASNRPKIITSSLLLRIEVNTRSRGQKTNASSHDLIPTRSRFAYTSRTHWQNTCHARLAVSERFSTSKNARR